MSVGKWVNQLSTQVVIGLAICWLPFGFAWATPKAAESADAPVTRSSEAAKPVFAKPQAVAKSKQTTTAKKAQDPKSKASGKHAKGL